MKKALGLMVLLVILSGCSASMPQLDLATVDKQAKSVGLEGAADVGLLAFGALAEVAGFDNFGTTHYVMTKGIGRNVEDFADYQFSAPEQEWISDLVAITGTGLASAYWVRREGSMDGANLDKRMDAYLPLIPFGQMLWKRLRYVQ